MALLLFVLSTPLHAAEWLPSGPDGGDARALAVDPHDDTHLFLGSAIGWIYESHDGGASWKRLALLGQRDDLVLDSLVVDRADPKHIVVGAWVLGSADGGLYISNDGGVSWRSDADMHGQSIRALYAAPSDPQMLVAGTLKGVYRSTDGGEHWTSISPAGSQELHEVESIAIDPVDPKIIYAGTWHLPWKTVDGGEHWSNIKQGIIDDSDVFSIILDPKNPKVVYASACSGIYKSETAGEKFQKVQGIPSTARRTRVLMQDPTNQNIVFAGTTEGLWRTTESGTNWQRMTGPEVIVNDVYVSAKNPNRVILATDRGGVLASNDGGKSFSASNNGFSARQVVAYVADAAQPSRLYVGVINDKAEGGVFVSDNGGLNWTQKSGGLDGHDVFSLGQTPDGTVIAGTRHGIYRLQGSSWSRVSDVFDEQEVQPKVLVAKKTGAGKATAGRAKAVAARRAVKPKVVRTDLSDVTVNAIARSDQSLYAASTEGLLRSVSGGASWRTVHGLEPQGWNFVAAEKSTVAVADLRSAMISADAGETWTRSPLPQGLQQVGALAVDDTGGIWIGGEAGVFLSEDHGASWQGLKNLYVRDVTNLFYDAASQRLLISSGSKNAFVYAYHVPDKTLRYWKSGWNLRFVRPVGESLIGSTTFDGMVIQPRMVDSGTAAGH
ncbi:MAG: hypothetical protein M3Y50_12225 [Acidobacteriota bacterium]|nr:hypothetical protein [Acidobacteriota bacterium]